MGKKKDFEEARKRGKDTFYKKKKGIYLWKGKKTESYLKKAIWRGIQLGGRKKAKKQRI